MPDPADEAHTPEIRTLVWRRADSNTERRNRVHVIIDSNVLTDHLRRIIADAVGLPVESVEILALEPAVLTPDGRITRPPRTRHTDMPSDEWPDDLEGMGKLIALMMDRRWRATRDGRADVAARMDDLLPQARRKLQRLKEHVAEDGDRSTQ